MSTFLISSAKLISPGHELNGQQVDIFIKDGVIEDIGKTVSIDEDTYVKTIQAEGAVVSAGFFDLNVNIGEPGYETKEDISTGTAAAAAGGFTAVAVQPNTNPAVHSRAEVALLVNAAKGNVVDVYPVGAISKKREGSELAELYDMKVNGAVAFSDGNRSVQHADLMGRALLYAKGFDGLIMSFAQDDSIAAGSQMNEGEQSTFLGMKGIPNLAESIIVSRDLFLAEYNDAAIHFSTISSKESVDLIKQAKAKGLKVTCDVAAHNLVYTDQQVVGFDSNYKVSPPLRTQADVDALLQGLREGVIDAVVSQHTPHEVEFKNVEFQIAKNGITGLQTALPLLIQAGLSESEIVEKLAVGPRKVLGMQLPEIKKGQKANLVVFDVNEKWTFDASTNKSKGKNNPLFGQQINGKVKLVINNNQLIVNK